MFKKSVLLFSCIAFLISCEKDEKYSFTDTPYIYGQVYPCEDTMVPFYPYAFFLGYIRDGAEYPYNSYPYKPIKNAKVTFYWRNDSTYLYNHGNSMNYHDINYMIRPKPGDYVGIKAEFNSKTLKWDGYIPTVKPEPVNLPANNDTIDIWIAERGITDPDNYFKKADKGKIFIAIAPPYQKYLKSFGFYYHDNSRRFFTYYTFKDSLSMPFYIDTNTTLIKLTIVSSLIDSSIAAAHLLDGNYHYKDDIVLDKDLELYLNNAKQLSLKERSNIRGDGVGLIFYKSSDIRRLIGRIRR